MLIAVHATRTEAGTYHVRLVVSPTNPDRDPAVQGVLETATTAVWSLGFPSRSDGHTLEASLIPRQALRTVAKELVRAAIVTVAGWREEEIPMPEIGALPFSTTV